MGNRSSREHQRGQSYSRERLALHTTVWSMFANRSRDLGPGWDERGSWWWLVGACLRTSRTATLEEREVDSVECYLTALIQNAPVKLSAFDLLFVQKTAISSLGSDTY